MKEATAQTLHGDILNNVLYYTLPSSIKPGKALSASPLNASHVCRSWRAAVVENPKLWASLSVELFDGSEASAPSRTRREGTGSIAKCIDLWLHRSSPLPIDIPILGDLAEDEDEVVVEKKRKKEKRLGKFVSKMHQRGRRIIGNPSDHSRSLSYFRHPSSKRPIIFDASSLSRLRFLALLNGMVRFPATGTLPQMSNLSVLHISTPQKHSLGDILSLLGASPNLKKITLVFADAVIASPTPEVKTVTLDHLSELHLDFYFPCKLSSAHFISRLSCPVLSTLVLSDYQRLGPVEIIDDMEEIGRFLERDGSGALLNEYETQV